MNIRSAINGVLSFLTTQRQTGSSSTLANITKHAEVYILISDRDQAKLPMFKDVPEGTFITIADLVNGSRIHGLPKRPVVVDNYVLMKLLAASDSKIRGQENLIGEIRSIVEKHTMDENRGVYDI